MGVKAWKREARLVRYNFCDGLDLGVARFEEN